MGKLTENDLLGVEHLKRKTEEEKILNFRASPDDLRRIDAIIQRVQMLLRLAGRQPIDWVQTRMDLIVAANHNPGRLDLTRLLEADTDTFARDTGALIGSINRRTGEIPPSVAFLHHQRGQLSLH